MNKNIPLKIEVISDEDQETCRISSPRQIESLLRGMAESATSCALYYNPNLNFIMTTILDVDEDGFWIEPGSSASVNAHVEESKQLTLVGSDGRVKIQFSAIEASPVTYDGEPAFFLALPKQLYRLQRREYFRLSLPPSEQLHCLIKLAVPEGEPGQDAVLDMVVSDIELAATDISGGGVGLIHVEGEDDIRIDEIYRDCNIQLPSIGPVRVDLVVKNIIPLNRNRAGKMVQRAGCEFRNLDPQTANKLQRFITEKQRTLAARGIQL